MKHTVPKAITLVLFLLLVGLNPAVAVIPLPSSPSWTSNDNDYATGGSLADINGDGFIDLCTGNGNDMNMDYNGVYLNNAGVLEASASWRSTDNGYNAHCYAGDVDNDGDVDLAVAYLGAGGSGELKVRVYRNQGTGLGQQPWWKAGDQHSSFDCCLGDVDLDGDMDLAISAGDAYSSEIDSVRIYRNNGGVFDTLPFWTAHEGTASDAIRFADIDNDGDLDLFVGQRGRVSMYRNNNGSLELTPSWVARTNVGWILRVALGDYDNDGYLDLAAASNDQLGDPNSIKVFHNNSGTLDTIARFNMLRVGSSLYSSCVEWADVNGDGFADLAAGGWWRPAVVFENRAGTLDTTATWSWSPSNRYDLVCEALVWGDIRNSHLSATSDLQNGTGSRHLFSLPRRPVQSLDSVKVDGSLVPRSGYCCDLTGAWVSFASSPPVGTDNVAFYYSYSTHPDLVVTNWDQSHGNHLFLNTTPVGVAEIPSAAVPPRLTAAPNPFAAHTTLRLSPASGRAPVRVLDAAGRVVMQSADGNLKSGIRLDFNSLPPGVYFASTPAAPAGLKLVHMEMVRAR